MRRNKPIKNEITLMTLLANEATADSRKLLKKYNKPEARDCADLEVKLAQLYFDTPDKLAIEKDFAEIHPHKNWILKRTKIEVVEIPKVEDVEKLPKVVEQPKSNADGDCGNPNCPVHGKCCVTSNAEGIQTKPSPKTDEQSEILRKQNEEYVKNNPLLVALPTLALVAMATVVIFAITSINKNKS